MISNAITSIAADKKGNLWFGTNDGVSIHDGINWINYTTKDGLILDNISTITIDSLDNKWFGTFGGGVKI